MNNHPAKYTKVKDLKKILTNTVMDPYEDYSPGDQYRPYQQMQNVYDKLLILNFEKEFLKMTRIRSFHRLYFMCPTNPGEQFFNFVSLSTWLIKKCGKDIEMAQESDDPNVLISSILEHMKTLGDVEEYNSNRMKSGFGPDVVGVLDFLTDKALIAVEHAWLPPIVMKELKEDDEVDEDDQEVILEKIEEEMEAYYSSEGEDDLIWVQGPTNAAATPEVLQDTGKILQPDFVDAEQWRLEVERVLPQLKITIQPDAQDWRQRLEQMKTFSEEVNTVVEQLEVPMEGMISKARSVLDKVKTRESFINDHFEALLMELSFTQDNVATTKDRHRELSNNISSKNRTMAHLNDELETLRRQLDDRGSIMADGAPISATKRSIASLNKELGDMEVEIAVMEHYLVKSLSQEKATHNENQV